MKERNKVADKIKKSNKTIITKVVEPEKPVNKFIAPIIFMGRYFKGSWQELRKVRWPNRRATWGMTAAVVMFTGFFVALIVFLDWVFNLLFKLIIK